MPKYIPLTEENLKIINAFQDAFKDVTSKRKSDLKEGDEAIGPIVLTSIKPDTSFWERAKAFFEGIKAKSYVMSESTALTSSHVSDPSKLSIPEGKISIDTKHAVFSEIFQYENKKHKRKIKSGYDSKLFKDHRLLTTALFGALIRQADTIETMEERDKFMDAFSNAADAILQTGLTESKETSGNFKLFLIRMKTISQEELTSQMASRRRTALFDAVKAINLKKVTDGIDISLVRLACNRPIVSTTLDEFRKTLVKESTQPNKSIHTVFVNTQKDISTYLAAFAKTNCDDELYAFYSKKDKKWYYTSGQDTKNADYKTAWQLRSPRNEYKKILKLTGTDSYKSLDKKLSSRIAGIPLELKLHDHLSNDKGTLGFRVTFASVRSIGDMNTLIKNLSSTVDDNSFVLAYLEDQRSWFLVAKDIDGKLISTKIQENSPYKPLYLRLENKSYDDAIKDAKKLTITLASHFYRSSYFVPYKEYCADDKKGSKPGEYKKYTLPEYVAKIVTPPIAIKASVGFDHDGEKYYNFITDILETDLRIENLFKRYESHVYMIRSSGDATEIKELLREKEVIIEELKHAKARYTSSDYFKKQSLLFTDASFKNSEDVLIPISKDFNELFSQRIELKVASIFFEKITSLIELVNNFAKFIASKECNDVISSCHKLLDQVHKQFKKLVITLQSNIFEKNQEKLQKELKAWGENFVGVLAELKTIDSTLANYKERLITINIRHFSTGSEERSEIAKQIQDAKYFLSDGLRDIFGNTSLSSFYKDSGALVEKALDTLAEIGHEQARHEKELIIKEKQEQLRPEINFASIAKVMAASSSIDESEVDPIVAAAVETRNSGKASTLLSDGIKDLRYKLTRTTAELNQARNEHKNAQKNFEALNKKYSDLLSSESITTTSHAYSQALKDVRTAKIKLEASEVRFKEINLETEELHKREQKILKREARVDLIQLKGELAQINLINAEKKAIIIKELNDGLTLTRNKLNISPGDSLNKAFGKLYERLCVAPRKLAQFLNNKTIASKKIDSEKFKANIQFVNVLNNESTHAFFSSVLQCDNFREVAAVFIRRAYYLTDGSLILPQYFNKRHVLKSLEPSANSLWDYMITLLQSLNPEKNIEETSKNTEAFASILSSSMTLLEKKLAKETTPAIVRRLSKQVKALRMFPKFLNEYKQIKKDQEILLSLSEGKNWRIPVNELARSPEKYTKNPESIALINTIKEEHSSITVFTPELPKNAVKANLSLLPDISKNLEQKRRLTKNISSALIKSQRNFHNMLLIINEHVTLYKERYEQKTQHHWFGGWLHGKTGYERAKGFMEQFILADNLRKLCDALCNEITKQEPHKVTPEFIEAKTATILQKLLNELLESIDVSNKNGRWNKGSLKVHLAAAHKKGKDALDLLSSGENMPKSNILNQKISEENDNIKETILSDYKLMTAKRKHIRAKTPNVNINSDKRKLEKESPANARDYIRSLKAAPTM